jgi:hypothetical protein
MNVGLILPKYPEPKRRTGKYEDSRHSTADLIVLDGLTKHWIDWIFNEFTVDFHQTDKQSTDKKEWKKYIIISWI